METETGQPEPVLRYARIELTDHARLRVVQRSIPDWVILDVLAAPERAYADRDELVAERVPSDGKPWKVVYVEEQDAKGVFARAITVHRIQKLSAL